MYSLRDMFSAHQQSVGGLKNDGFPTIINDESRHCVGARSLGGSGRTGVSTFKSAACQFQPCSLFLANVSSPSSQRCAVDGLVLQSLQTVVSLTLKCLKQILHFTSLQYFVRRCATFSAICVAVGPSCLLNLAEITVSFKCALYCMLRRRDASGCQVTEAVLGFRFSCKSFLADSVKAAELKHPVSFSS